MDSTAIDEIFDYALVLAKQCGEVILSAFSNRDKPTESKSRPDDLVTETDKQVEDIVIKRLKEKFPDHKFCGEESVSAGEKFHLTDAPTWMIDPIDGTLNFVHSFPYSCISLGLLVNKEPVLGIIYNPMTGDLFTAKSGQGAFKNGTRLHVSSCTDLSKALLATEIHAPDLDVKVGNLKRLLPKIQGVRSMGSCAINCSHVAAGGLDVYFEQGIHCWDMAAAATIIREAGGVVSSMKGGPVDILSREILVASSQALIDQTAPLLETVPMERD